MHHQHDLFQFTFGRQVVVYSTRLFVRQDADNFPELLLFDLHIRLGDEHAVNSTLRSPKVGQTPLDLTGWPEFSYEVMNISI